MPRKGPVVRREIPEDPVYSSRVVSQLIGRVLLSGKKSLAQRIVYSALDKVSMKASEDPVSVLRKALDNVRPSLEVRSRRVGGSTYQVPVPVRSHRADALAIRWLTVYSRARREKSMVDRLASEILDASNGVGATVKCKEDTHRMAESNRAFAHYRW
ncbi:30S ribosomal protein S7 [Tropheryma whipplei]|uniref:Small ribosomal subunit protein uS7 n=2 Tax=Tropheryma whipplei TaxID=2039 RepID=RS7_TROWT|nr:30S ribosomal protein S7 [Tropheryma whipplei]Q83FP0.1 RecName: Full=Small ribosomal subunit protein uS7; AltName: Full=30S ribosomal protein S7 [Tropheryma whipplei str. Twist]Q83HC8.1 RecName: Full=Small ribosomal subunit protein uS7; AltName: Full=30S ribosomal protein S7 [Tropheryma whipplei TW08/27]AAO44773.1 30S ribosomal protein S7 [Tropheryma whipplei str. Twist]MCO8182510.1 30S ribosomal protein S7 [Tropheryma whipplei]MCO8190352.1 30S ribosomal protein S7 [Tropheryma whipplei]CAD